nr:opsin-5A [Biomphalaria glabrata]
MCKKNETLVKQPRYTGVVLIGVLIYALIWTAAPLFGWGVYAPEPFGTSCTVSWKNPDRSYVTAVFTGVLAVPLFIMLVCYGCVVYHMSLSASRVERYFAERKRRAKSQNRLVRMAVIMCVCFLIIWLPYSVLSICFAYIPAFDVHPVQSAIPTVLAKISHVINPVIYFTMNPYYRRRVKCFNCWQSVTSNVSINTGGKMTEECPAERSSDQATQLPLSTYITPSPSMPHNIHAARYNATDRGSPAGSLGAYSDDEADNGTVTLTEVGSVDIHSSVTLKKQHLQDLILTLSKESGGVKNYQEGAQKNSLPNDYPPNNVAKSGSKSLTRLMLVLDKRNFKGFHKESSLDQSETRKLQSNDPDTSKNLLSAQETSGLNTKAGFLSNYNNLAANCGNLNDSEDGDGHLLRDKVRKKLVGVVLSTANGDSSHDSSASSTPEPDSSRSPSARSSDDINSNEISNPKRLVRFMAIHNGVDTATDQNENLETFVLVCPEEIEHLMVDKNSFPTELITNA